MSSEDYEASCKRDQKFKDRKEKLLKQTFKNAPTNTPDYKSAKKQVFKTLETLNLEANQISRHKQNSKTEFQKFEIQSRDD